MSCGHGQMCDKFGCPDDPNWMGDGCRKEPLGETIFVIGAALVIALGVAVVIALLYF